MRCASRSTFPTGPRCMRSRTAHANLYATVGRASRLSRHAGATVEDLVALAALPKVVAIGETGLDYYRQEGDLEWQRERFRTHIRAAREAGKPLVIHTRAAADGHAAHHARGGRRRGGRRDALLHRDAGRRACARSISASTSRSRASSRSRTPKTLKEVARAVPLDRMLIETDSPTSRPSRTAASATSPRTCRTSPRKSRGCAASRRRGRRGDLRQFLPAVRDRSRMSH